MRWTQFRVYPFGDKFTLWIVFVSLCEGFNVEDSTESLHYVRPSIRHPRKSVTTSEKENKNSFFGYSFQLDNSGRLTVGSPYFADRVKTRVKGNSKSNLPTGNIFSCSTDKTKCHAIGPPDLKPGDLFGESLDVTADGTSLVCSPTKQQICTGAKYSPGYCYKSSDRGHTWRPDPLTRNISCPHFALDLIFLLDGSFSVGVDNFKRVKDWMKSVASHFIINDDTTRLGVVQYSHFYKNMPLNEQPYMVTEIALGEYTDQEAFMKAVNKIKLHGYTTFTAHALNKTVLDFQSSERFNSTSTSKVLILLTDGRSKDPEYLEQSASYVRSLGITTFSVGVGRAVKKELQIIAGDTERVYTVSNFTDLDKIVSKLQTAILEFALEGASQGNASVLTFKLQLAEMGFSTYCSSEKITIEDS
ncbi:unnamed protein product [Clavelina lepadiformis]|uniref:VWFA domain-containing protein n=1 Tax=Clavelina lepadiformis TaxID=159417 RepID=A0ABP0F2F0_CLALP